MNSGSFTLMEELMLLGLHGEKGHQVASTALPYGLAGAILVELMVHGRIRLSEEFVEAADRKAVGDPVLDEALAIIRSASRRKRPKGWVSALPGRLKALPRRVAERLVQRGVLRAEERKVLWIFPVTRYPERDSRPEREIRQRVRDAILRDRALDERTAALIALMGACRLVDEVFEKDERKPARKRIKEIVRGNPYGDAVRKVVEETEATVMLVTTSAAVAAASS